MHCKHPLHFIEKPEYVNSLYVSKISYPGNYPEITMSNYEYFTGLVFLIHNNISEISELDKIKLANLASAWYDYSIGIILGIKYPKTIYRYANKNEIYHSDKRLNSSELRKLKIFTPHINLSKRNKEKNEIMAKIINTVANLKYASLLATNNLSETLVFLKSS